MKDLEQVSDKEQLRGLGALRLEKRRLRGDLVTLHNFLTRGKNQVGVGLFYLVASNMSRGQSQAALGEVYVGHEEEFLHRKGD